MTPVHVGKVLQWVIRDLRDKQETKAYQEKAEQILMDLREKNQVGNAALAEIRRALGGGV